MKSYPQITQITQIFGGKPKLANETATAGMLGMANELTAAEWIQLSPLGEFPHARGLQRVDAAAIGAMANHFNSALGKVGRALFGGVPFYVGHPDVPGIANEYPDKKAYGWIKGMEARADGLYGQVEWSEPGKLLIANKHYKYFSPYWDARELGAEKGRTVYQPTMLLSVGLTNQPNLPVKPLANEQKENEMQFATLIALLGLANTATEADATTEINRLKGEAGKVSALANEKTTLANEKTTVATGLENEKTEHGKTKTTLANVVKQRNTLALDNAVKAGKVTPAQMAEWEPKLTADWENQSKALAAGSGKVMNTTARTAGLGGRRETFANADEQGRQAKVQSLVAKRQKETGEDYETAFANVRSENSELFGQMRDSLAPEQEA